MGLAYAIAMSSACVAAENDKGSAASPIVVAQAQPTEADKKKLADEIQKRYKPGAGKSSLPSGTSRMNSGASTCTQSTAQIAACSVSCSAACIFKCAPPAGVPWGSDCKACVTPCMDKCTGCGPGST